MARTGAGMNGPLPADVSGGTAETVVHSRIRIVGLNCPKCVVGLQATLEALPGVRQVAIHVEHGDVDVEHLRACDRERLFEAIEQAGYDAV